MIAMHLLICVLRVSVTHTCPWDACFPRNGLTAHAHACCILLDSDVSGYVHMHRIVSVWPYRVSARAYVVRVRAGGSAELTWCAKECQRDPDALHTLCLGRVCTGVSGWRQLQRQARRRMHTKRRHVAVNAPAHACTGARTRPGPDKSNAC